MLLLWTFSPTLLKIRPAGVSPPIIEETWGQGESETNIVVDIGTLSPLDVGGDRRGKRQFEGNEKQGLQKKKKRDKSRRRKDKVPKDAVTVFDYVELKTLKKNMFSHLPKIVDLGTTLLEKKEKRQKQEDVISQTL